MNVMVSQSPTIGLFVQQLDQADNNENISVRLYLMPGHAIQRHRIMSSRVQVLTSGAFVINMPFL